VREKGRRRGEERARARERERENESKRESKRETEKRVAGTDADADTDTDTDVDTEIEAETPTQTQTHTVVLQTHTPKYGCRPGELTNWRGLFLKPGCTPPTTVQSLTPTTRASHQSAPGGTAQYPSRPQSVLLLGAAKLYSVQADQTRTCTQCHRLVRH
jgi:cytoskeletal protein RodZ